MGLIYRLEDYERYLRLVGAATYIDLTRRTDPARVPQVWANLSKVVDTYGAPWIVQLWTKDVVGTLRLGEGLLRRLMALGTTVTAQVTVTGLAGTVWEPRVVPRGFRDICRLAELIGGPDHIKWRYDPIIPDVHRVSVFHALVEQASTEGIHRGVINFIAPPGRYRRVDRRLADLLPGWSQGMPGYDRAWMIDTARQLVKVASQAGISLSICAENAALTQDVDGLGAASCGDYAWFCALSGRHPAEAPYKGSRVGCGCARYFDVGRYGYWSRCHGCAYCYAG